MNGEIIRYYTSYEGIIKSLKDKTYDLMDDSIGQYNKGVYSVDITLRDYDGIWCIDYDVYSKRPGQHYLDGGRVCEVDNMPDTDAEFWRLVAEKFEEHIKE